MKIYMKKSSQCYIRLHENEDIKLHIWHDHNFLFEWEETKY